MPEERVTVEVLPDKDHMGPQGNIVGAGGTYETTKSQAEQLARRQLVKIKGPVAPSEAISGATVPPLPSEVEDRWTLKISPEDYLHRFPEGPQAALAKRLVASGRGGEVASGAATVAGTTGTTATAGTSETTPTSTFTAPPPGGTSAPTPPPSTSPSTSTTPSTSTPSSLPGEQKPEDSTTGSQAESPSEKLFPDNKL